MSNLNLQLMTNENNVRKFEEKEFYGPSRAATIIRKKMMTTMLPKFSSNRDLKHALIRAGSKPIQS